jgi:hypothetical protein
MKSFTVFAIAAVVSAIKLENQKQTLPEAMMIETKILGGPYNKWWDRKKLDEVYTEEQRALDVRETEG